MTRHPIELQIERADRAINCEDFDTLMDIYSDEAVLVVKPGMNVVGKVEIRKALQAIAEYFNHSLEVRQAGMKIRSAKMPKPRPSRDASTAVEVVDSKCVLDLSVLF